MVKVLAAQADTATCRAVARTDPVRERTHSDEGEGERRLGENRCLLPGFEPLAPLVAQSLPP